jgi:hypothetical protein
MSQYYLSMTVRILPLFPPTELTEYQPRKLSCRYQAHLRHPTSGSNLVRLPWKSFESQQASIGRSGLVGRASTSTSTSPTTAARWSKRLSCNWNEIYCATNMSVQGQRGIYIVYS